MFRILCRLAYETLSSIKNALKYNVYHRCLCYIINVLIFISSVGTAHYFLILKKCDQLFLKDGEPC